MDILRNIVASNLTDMAVSKFAKHFYKTIVKGRFPSYWCRLLPDGGGVVNDPKLVGAKSVGLFMDYPTLRESCPFTDAEREEFDRVFCVMPQTLLVVATSASGRGNLAAFRDRQSSFTLPAIVVYCDYYFEDEWLDKKDYKSAFVESLNYSNEQRETLAHEVVHFLDAYREDGSWFWRGKADRHPVYHQRPSEKNAHFFDLVSAPTVVKDALDAPDFDCFIREPYVSRYINRWGKGAYRQRLLSRVWEWWVSLREARGLSSPRRIAISG